MIRSLMPRWLSNFLSRPRLSALEREIDEAPSQSASQLAKHGAKLRATRQRRRLIETTNALRAEHGLEPYPFREVV